MYRLEYEIDRLVGISLVENDEVQGFDFLPQTFEINKPLRLLETTLVVISYDGLKLIELPQGTHSFKFTDEKDHTWIQFKYGDKLYDAVDNIPTSLEEILEDSI